MEQILQNWHIWWGRASWPNYFIHAEQTETEYGEGAPVHISEDAAWRCGPTLVIELLWRFEMVRPFRSGRLRRNRECTGPRQLRQPKWRSARAGLPGIIFSDGAYPKADVAFHASFDIKSENISLN